jgi:superfamily II DNA or RNA helicase
MPPVKVQVDNRIRVASSLPAEVVTQLCNALTFENPAHKKLIALGYKYNKEPKHISMWSKDRTHLTLPRGAMQTLREVFSVHGLDYEVEDNRTEGDASITGSYEDPWQLQGGCQFPAHRPVLWDHQRGIVDAIKRYEQVLLRSPTGCISGDSMIGINRAGKGSQMRLDHVVAMFNGGTASGKTWDLSIPTKVRARLSDGTIGLVTLRDAYPSGVKPVFEVKTADGHQLRATKDHRFLTASGWKRLEQIDVGDTVFVENNRMPITMGEKSKPWYKLRVVRHHPYAGRRGVNPEKGGFTVPFHRLVAEADLNDIEVEEFIARCQRGETDGLTFLDPQVFAVHHLDEDPHNNDVSNLEVCTHAEHKALHADHAKRNISVWSVLSTVVSIESVGAVQTYDLALDAPHNFLANGVVVHNSGKTTGLIGAIAEIGVPSIVIMWDSGLLKQWQERIESELGIPVGEQGLIRGSICRLRGITLAMQQTLNQWSDARWQQILPVFGLVACDEVQRYAASTFTKAVDRFPAKYRVGVSADERRKDGKQFIIYSMFGPVRHEVEKRTLIQKRLIHEVEVYVFPTEFSAPWYAEKMHGEADENGEKKKIFAEDFTNLITQMQCDVERNTLAAALVMECVNQNLPTLTFTHRVDHAKILEAMVSAQGISSGMALGGDDWSDEFNRTIAGLRDGSLMVGCGTFGKLGVGHDIPTIAAGVVVTPVHNNQAFFGQVKGRICRTSAGKQNARVIVLWDWKVFGLSPLYSLKKHNEVMRVWDSWNKRWKDVETFLKEVKHDGRFKAANTSKSAETSDVGGIFGKVR